MLTIVKKEIEEGCAALYEDVLVKLEHPDREGERALDIQTALLRSEIEQDSAVLHEDVQVKLEHPDHEGERALDIQTALWSEIEKDSAILHEDVQVKLEHPDREGERMFNMQTALWSEIEEPAALHDDVQVKNERPDRERDITLFELYAEHKVKDELVIGPVVLQKPGPSAENLFTDTKRRFSNKTAVPSIFPWNQTVSPVKSEFLTPEELNSLSDSGSEKNNGDPTEFLFGFASSATSVRDTESTAASDLETDYDVVIPFDASEIKKTYSKHGAPLFKKAKLKRNIEILEQEKLPEKVTVNTVTEKNVSEKFTAEASVDVQSTESAEDKQLTAEYKAFTCDDCRKQFQSKHELLQHLVIHNKDISKICFYCTECEYTTVTRDTLDKHFLTFHDSKRQHACETCSYRFETKRMLITHINRHHRVTIDFTCDICNKFKTNTIINFEVHLRAHGLEKHFSCPLCPYKCAQQDNLRIHIRTHTSEKPFHCEQCQYKCTARFLLKRHMRTHTGEKPFSCPQCQYKCNQENALKRHIMTHTGEKPFSCTQCRYKCNQQNALTRHIMTHTGEKPFSCTQCLYKCKEQSRLKTHLRTHTGEKPFHCKQCQYKCSQQTHLKVHISRQHNKGK